MFKIFILNLTDISVIMKRNKTFLKRRKQGILKLYIIEVEFVLGITAKPKKKKITFPFYLRAIIIYATSFQNSV